MKITATKSICYGKRPFVFGVLLFYISFWIAGPVWSQPTQISIIYTHDLPGHMLSDRGGPDIDSRFINHPGNGYVYASADDNDAAVEVPSEIPVHIVKKYHKDKEKEEDKSGQTKETTKDTDSQEQTLTININTADRELLQKLPGVGPVIAGRIIEYREKIGRFRRPEDIMKVKGIALKKFEKMKDMIVIKDKTETGADSSMK